MEGSPARDLGKRLRPGSTLEDGPATVDSFKMVDSSPGKALVELVLHDGRNRIVRRLMDAVGHRSRTWSGRRSARSGSATCAGDGPG